MRKRVLNGVMQLTNIINITGILSMHYFEFDKNFHFPGEKHDFWEMVYVDSGNIYVTANGKEHILGQGEIIFHKPNEFHTIAAEKKSANVCVICFATTSKAMEWFKNRRLFLPRDSKQYIKTIISEGRKTFDLPFNDPYADGFKFADNPPIGGLQMIKTSLEQLLITMLRAGTGESPAKKASSQDNTENQLVNTVIKILTNNVYGKVNVYEICQDLSYSKTHISKVFNETVGCSIIEYYTQLKITEAKKLIRERAYNFTEISDMLCFNNPHYFSKVFKKVTNMSPREYLSSVTI